MTPKFDGYAAQYDAWFMENENLFHSELRLFHSDAIMDKQDSWIAFQILFWTGMRIGELLALTPADFNFDKETVTINKSYQRLKGQDVITSPKTKKSNRTIKMPKFLCEEMKEYLGMIYGLKKKDRIFTVTKSYLHHEMDRGAKAVGVKRIRIHDLRHPYVKPTTKKFITFLKFFGQLHSCP